MKGAGLRHIQVFKWGATPCDSLAGWRYLWRGDDRVNPLPFPPAAMTPGRRFRDHMGQGQLPDHEH